MLWRVSQPRFRRRNYLVNLPYQLRNGFVIAASLLAYTMVLAVLIFEPIQQDLLRAADVEEQGRLAHIFREFHARFWPAMIVVVLLAGAHAMFAAHRVAGPLYRIRRTLEAFAAGDLHVRMKLRRWDRLKEFEGVVNGLAEALERRRDSIRERLAPIEEALAAGDLARARALVGEMRAEVPPETGKGGHPPGPA